MKTLYVKIMECDDSKSKVMVHTDPTFKDAYVLTMGCGIDSIGNSYNNIYGSEYTIVKPEVYHLDTTEIKSILETIYGSNNGTVEFVVYGENGNSRHLIDKSQPTSYRVKAKKIVSGHATVSLFDLNGEEVCSRIIGCIPIYRDFEDMDIMRAICRWGIVNNNDSFIFDSRETYTLKYKHGELFAEIETE